MNQVNVILSSNNKNLVFNNINAYKYDNIKIRMKKRRLSLAGLGLGLAGMLYSVTGCPSSPKVVIDTANLPAGTHEVWEEDLEICGPDKSLYFPVNTTIEKSPTGEIVTLIPEQGYSSNLPVSLTREVTTLSDGESIVRLSFADNPDYQLTEPWKGKVLLQGVGGFPIKFIYDETGSPGIPLCPASERSDTYSFNLTINPGRSPNGGCQLADLVDWACNNLPQAEGNDIRLYRVTPTQDGFTAAENIELLWNDPRANNGSLYHLVRSGQTDPPSYVVAVAGSATNATSMTSGNGSYGFNPPTCPTQYIFNPNLEDIPDGQVWTVHAIGDYEISETIRGTTLADPEVPLE